MKLKKLAGIILVATCAFSMGGCSGDNSSSTIPTVPTASSSSSVKNFDNELFASPLARQVYRDNKEINLPSWFEEGGIALKSTYSKVAMKKSAYTTTTDAPADLSADVAAGDDSLGAALGKKVLGGLAKSGLKYVFKLSLSAAFPNYESKAQKDLDNIDTQLTQISNTLNQVYNNTNYILKNQEAATKVGSLAYFQSTTDFHTVNTKLNDLISGISNFTNKFDQFYTDIYTKYYNTSTKAIDFSKIGNMSTDTFILTYFNAVEQDSNILYMAQNMLNSLINTSNDYTNDYKSMRASLLSLVGYDIVTGSNYINAQLSNQISNTGNLLVKAHFLVNFILIASNQSSTIKDYISNGPSYIATLCGDDAQSKFAHIDDPDTLNDIRNSFDANFNTTWSNKVRDNLNSILTNTLKNGDILAVFSDMENPLLFDNAMFVNAVDPNPTCIPIHYVVNYQTQTHSNINYFAADCLNGDGTSSVYQLYIPTYTDDMAINNISYLNAFGLTGDFIYDTMKNIVNPVGWLSSYANAHYNDDSDVSFDFCSSSHNNPGSCAPQYISIQMMQQDSLYGFGYTDKNNNFINQPGFNQRYYYTVDYPSTVIRYMFALTKNGHLFYGGLNGATKYFPYSYPHRITDLYKASIGFGVGYPGGWESTTINGLPGIHTTDDHTEVYSATGSNSVSVNNDGDSSKWQWGWGIYAGAAPQPAAAAVDVRKPISTPQLDAILNQ